MPPKEERVGYVHRGSAVEREKDRKEKCLDDSRVLLFTVLTQSSPQYVAGFKK